MRRITRTLAVLLLAGSTAGCVPTWFPFFGQSTPAPTATPTATPTPTAAATATLPASPLDGFESWVRDSFRAQGTISGSVTAKFFLGSTSGPVSGTFQVDRADSQALVSFKLLGATFGYESVAVDGMAYSRSNGGSWTKAPTSGKNLQAFLSNGVALTDEGVSPKFGRQLRELRVADPSGIDPSAFGLTAGGGTDNLAVQRLSFWVEEDGTPAGLSMDASLDQKVLGTPSHETVSLDIVIDSLSPPPITPPAT